MRAGLLVAVTDPAGQGERGCVAHVSLAGLAGGQQGFAGPIECLGLPARVASIPEDGRRALVMLGRMAVLAPLAAHLPEIGQRLSVWSAVASLLGKGENSGVALMTSGGLS
jgi:hypothetical protein